jgi:GNAT superfamily N-acetyltransferase
VIRVASEVVRSGRVIQVEGMFDVPRASESVVEWELPDELKLLTGGAPSQPWNVGLIVGPSGSGKTTIARAEFGADLVDREYGWPDDAAILDGFDKALSVKEVVGLLTAVGFGSPPAWLRPFRVLSTGEQFRATLARALSEADSGSFVVMDEFTSTVDRKVAQVGSHAVQKAIRRRNRQFVAVTCHFDVIDWLQPDWVYRPDSTDFEWRRLQRHPRVELGLAHVPRDAWRVFRHHHYLSGELHVAAKCVCAFHEGQPVAFNAYYKFPHPRVKNIMVNHRTVVLPDYQGLGIGERLTSAVGEYLHREHEQRYRTTLAHPALIAAYRKSPRWREERGRNRPSASRKPKRLVKQHSDPRKLATTAFEYVPLEADPPEPALAGVESSEHAA